MNDDLLAATTRRILSSAQPWDALADAGLLRLSVPPELGGSGGTWADACTVLIEVGRSCLPLPVAEDLLAAWCCADAGSMAPAGRGCVVARGVPSWTDGADWCVTPDGTLCSPSPEEEFRNLAGEPRSIVETYADSTLRHEVRAALARSALMLGAAECALDATTAYARGRIQFGRPIGAFQAVQQRIAMAVGEVSALRSPCASAAATLESSGPSASASVFAAAATKLQANLTAGCVAATAHQVHGAIGLALEHPLHRATTRLWAWHDEAGDERCWADVLADVVSQHDVWELVSSA